MTLSTLKRLNRLPAAVKLAGSSDVPACGLTSHGDTPGDRETGPQARAPEPENSGGGGLGGVHDADRRTGRKRPYVASAVAVKKALTGAVSVNAAAKALGMTRPTLERFVRPRGDLLELYNVAHRSGMRFRKVRWPR